MESSISIVEKSKAAVRRLIAENAPPHIFFHGLSHTEEVVKAVQIIGNYEKVSSYNAEIVLLAAWFHDTGYIHTYSRHEELSKVIAQLFLEKQGYSPQKLQQVLSCIDATKTTTSPGSIIQKILCDADHYHLSQAGYWKKNKLLKRELEFHQNKNFGEKEWYLKNLKFLEGHRYFTNFGQQKLELKKKLHITKNIQILEKLTEQVIGQKIT